MSVGINYRRNYSIGNSVAFLRFSGSLFISLIFMFLSNSLLVILGILKWRSCFNFPASFNQKMILKEENIEGERTSHRAQVQTQF